MSQENSPTENQRKQIEQLESRVNRMYLELRDEIRARCELQVKFLLIEQFVKEQYPEFFAGEVGTIVDPDLKPIPIIYGEPQEPANGKG